ncbi:MAG: 7-cyano-7-deazaguanine synthase QueC [Candidatus Endonucleobacter bathymodioli]|uniref:7-cyano-7-deazaguanine synthase n=1 Tax=Candidatus Endonucleibacter bathymodioli TaxID=539814 RepID=A0AA90SDV1_9GAMM|nr:7-cyano-7-deazaguanine synthase QueC [Candidatus Endonucleobacter bathymodioli]
MHKKAVILLSGGLDSATCLAIARDQEYECYTISIDYGQRHRSELIAAQRIAKAHGAKEHKVLTLNLNEIGGSALTDDIDIPEELDSGIPITYVPARNTVFLSLALGWAEVLGIRDIFIGANNIDYAGYPDCRPEFLEAFEKMANLATKAGVEGDHFHILAPLLELTKADIIKKGYRLNVDYSLTISCYQADPQGLACGTCSSCRYRIKGFKEAGLKDVTQYTPSALQAIIS